MRYEQEEDDDYTPQACNHTIHGVLFTKELSVIILEKIIPSLITVHSLITTEIKKVYKNREHVKL